MSVAAIAIGIALSIVLIIAVVILLVVILVQAIPIQQLTPPPPLFTTGSRLIITSQLASQSSSNILIGSTTVFPFAAVFLGNLTSDGEKQWKVDYDYPVQGSFLETYHLTILNGSNALTTVVSPSNHNLAPFNQSITDQKFEITRISPANLPLKQGDSIECTISQRDLFLTANAYPSELISFLPISTNTASQRWNLKIVA